MTNEDFFIPSNLRLFLLISLDEKRWRPDKEMKDSNGHKKRPSAMGWDGWG